MKVLDSFMKKNAPMRRKSQLVDFREDILTLYENNYRVEQIQEFLEKVGVETTKRNIYYFLQKCTKTNNAGGKTKQKSENKETNDNNDTEVQNEDEEVTLTSMRRIMKEREKNQGK